MAFTKVIPKLSQQKNFAVVRKNLDGNMTAFAECRYQFRGLIYVQKCEKIYKIDPT